MDGMNKVNSVTMQIVFCTESVILPGVKFYTFKTLCTLCLQNSPNNLSGISNPPGTPRDDGELSGNFLHSFQSENVSLCFAPRLTSPDCNCTLMKPELQHY